MPIETPDQLPEEWRKKYTDMRLRYRSTRMWATADDADRAAFLDVRQEYWRSLKADERAKLNPPRP